MAKIKLTKRAIDALPLPKEGKGERYFDTELSGFGLSVYPSGKKSFFIYYGPSTGRRRMSLGKYGVFTPEEARKMAREKLTEVMKGQDPLEDKRSRKDQLTFGQWVDTYLERVKARKKHPREDERYLKRAKKSWGSRALDKINPELIEKMVADIHAEGKPTTANRFLASVRACLQDAWRKEMIPSNPAMKVRPYSESAPRSRVFTDAEYKRLLEAIEDLRFHSPYDEGVYAAFRMLVETGARVSEVLHARWQDVDLDQQLWVIPTTKSGKRQVIPIPASLVSVLNQTPQVADFIVAGRSVDKPRSELRRPWDWIKTRAKLADISLHDIRRTFGLQVSKAHGLHVASKLLRHSDIRVTEQHYAPLGIDSLREAVEAHANVVPFPKAGGE